MGEVKWIKLDTDVFNNRKIKQIESMPDGDSIIVIWLKLLSLAGKINDCGMVYFTNEVPYTEEMLATEFGRKLPTIQLALITFEKFKMVEIINDVMYISNWEKYQNTEKLGQIREANRLRQADYRSKKRICHSDITDVSHQSNATDIDLELDKDTDKEYKDIVAKAPVISFNSLINDFSDNEELRESLKAYKEMRIKMKKGFTINALKLNLTKLDKLAKDISKQKLIVDQSIERTWTTFYPLKENIPDKKNKFATDQAERERKLNMIFNDR